MKYTVYGIALRHTVGMQKNSGVDSWRMIPHGIVTLSDADNDENMECIALQSKQYHGPSVLTFYGSKYSNLKFGVRKIY